MVANRRSKRIGDKLFTGALHPQCVPDVDIEVIVSGHEEPAGLAKCHRRDTADDVVVRILGQLLVGPDVVQLHRGVVRACAEGRALREELQCPR